MLLLCYTIIVQALRRCSHAIGILFYAGGPCPTADRICCAGLRNFRCQRHGVPDSRRLYVLGGSALAALVLLAVYLFLVLVITLLRVYLPKESKHTPFVLWTRQKNSEGYTGGKNWSMLVGNSGTALTTLRPAGTILVDGKRLDVSSQ